MVIAILLTDIEGSTRLMERAPGAYREALALHHELLRRTVGVYDGTEIQETGDGFYFAFRDVESATRAAITIQSHLPALPWPPETGPLLVRMAVNFGEAEFLEGQYRGPIIHVAARLLAASNGGQILSTAHVAEALNSKVRLHALGTYWLKGFEKPEPIFQIEGDATPTPLRLEHAKRHNLPEETDQFIGRSDEVLALTAHLEPSGKSRAVVVTGTGGIGKTRLALCVAKRLLPHFEHNALFVDLAEVSNAESAPQVILEAAGVSSEDVSNSHSALKSHFGRDPILLVLDNAENLAAELSGVILQIQRELPGACILATSRVRSSLGVMVEFPVGPLKLPPERCTAEQAACYDSVRLFLDRAKKARPEMELNAENSKDVISICRSLEGFPLAVEIAAARLQVMTLVEIAEEFRQTEFSGEEINPIARVFAWSCSLLPPSIHQFLLAMSVFRGGWTTVAAMAISDVNDRHLTLAYIHYLITCSLVRTSSDSTGLRFSLLKPIRQLAESQLGEAKTDAIKRHSDFFLKMVGDLDQAFETPAELELMSKVESEIANILAALDREPDRISALYSAIHLHVFALHRRCNAQLRKILEDRLLSEDSGDLEIEGKAWHALGALARTARQKDKALQAFQRAVEIFDKCSYEHGLHTANYNIAHMNASKECERAREASLQVLEHFRGQNDLPGCATILSMLAWQERKLGLFDHAILHAEECLEVSELCGAQRDRIGAHATLGAIAMSEGKPEVALVHYEQALSICIKLGQEFKAPETLVLLATATAALEDWRRTAFLTGAARAWLNQDESLDATMSEEPLKLLPAMEQSAKENLGEKTFDQFAKKGAQSSPANWLAAELFLQVETKAA